MARQRGFPLVRGRTSRRQTSWGFGPGGTAVTAFSAGTTAFVGSSLVPVQEGMTIVRLRGRLSVFLTLATAVGDGFQGAFGIGIAPTVAVASGVGAVPSPITEQDSENWMYWTPISIHGPVVSSTELNSPAMAMDVEVDSKAMRKFTDAEISLYAMIELVEIGTATGQLFFDSRVLLKL